MREYESNTKSYIDRKKETVPVKPRNTATVTFSLPPDMARELRRVAKEEDRTVSELLREGFRLYTEERKWSRRQRAERLRSRPGAELEETKKEQP